MAAAMLTSAVNGMGLRLKLALKWEGVGQLKKKKRRQGEKKGLEFEKV